MQGTPLQAGENRSLPLDMPILPERLKELGYRTHLVGKWHLGSGYKQFTPTRRGFDTHFGYWNGWVGYFDYMISVTLPDNVTRYNGLDLHDGFDPQWQYMGQYATDLFSRKSVEVIEKHDPVNPLFLLVTHLAAHTGRDGVELGVPNITRTNQIYGGDVRNLGNIDGVNQWPSISQNLTTKRTEILLNIDEALNASAILGYEGRYKLVSGTYQDGIYDQYYGDDGRGPENPPYNIQLVLNSLVNRAIQTLPEQAPLFPQDVATTRRQLDLSWCRASNFTPNFVCRGFCLFDIYRDPCETTNIIGNSENGNIVQHLQARLSDFFTQLVPQGNSPIDPNSDPRRFNNTWWTWLEEPPLARLGFFWQAKIIILQ
ncbi:hypothetical protein NQ314_013811 [Rhamnusium bicolor]|uniref:Sulfatase N-terminal domain-containing protein n=1 Tax=Rhamnusium bicolor TaxID=1586634 RepID=A0AAV8X4D5_9CUCU|nr:hypothetical protein NQ314_013811 [Rhamnusium bicolor]